MAQQTAVKKLLYYITEHGFELEYEMEMSFLDMKKELLEDCWVYGRANYDWDKTFEQYYNETYGTTT